jgi:hypothetical protein
MGKHCIKVYRTLQKSYWARTVNYHLSPCASYFTNRLYHFFLFSFTEVYMFSMSEWSNFYCCCSFVDRYPLQISNAWTGTKLIINEDVPEINDFKNRSNILTISLTFNYSFILFLKLLQLFQWLGKLPFLIFIYSLPLDNTYATQNQLMSSSSQRFSAQSSAAGSQLSPADQFIQGHRILKLSDIIKLNQVSNTIVV